MFLESIEIWVNYLYTFEYITFSFYIETLTVEKDYLVNFVNCGLFFLNCSLCLKPEFTWLKLNATTGILAKKQTKEWVKDTVKHKKQSSVIDSISKESFLEWAFAR